MSTPQTRPSTPVSAGAGNVDVLPAGAGISGAPPVTETIRQAPLGKTQLRLTVWAVPGREPGQTRNLRHLTWGGPGDAVHLCYGGIADGDMEYPGEDMGRVSGRCHALKQAQAAVDAYVSGQRI
jgi:hypothetical protein